MSDEPLLSDFADDPSMTELLRAFLDGLSETIQRLELGMKQDDLHTLSRIGHQLKGAGGGYGFSAITEAGDRLQLAAERDRAVTMDVRQCAEVLVRVCRQAQLGSHRS